MPATVSCTTVGVLEAAVLEGIMRSACIPTTTPTAKAMGMAIILDRIKELDMALSKKQGRKFLQVDLNQSRANSTFDEWNRMRLAV